MNESHDEVPPEASEPAEAPATAAEAAPLDEPTTEVQAAPTGQEAAPPYGFLPEGAALFAGDQPPPPPGAWSPASGAPPVPPRRRRALVAAAVAAATLVAGGLGAGLGAAFGGSASLAPARSSLPSTPTAPLSAPGSVARVAALVKPAVVDISTTIATEVGSPPSPAEGTGMILTPSGEVLTNNHVVEDATSIRVSVGGSRTYAARVLGVDPVHDIALLQLEGASGLPTVSLGDSSTVAVGDPVVAIGNALGLGGSPSVVSGIVSAVGRTISASDAGGGNPETLHNLIQTSAPISPGDSGGPLVNLRGQVIGMDTAAASADGTGASIGFAIPINQAAADVHQIERGQAGNGVIIGESPFLGITEQPSYGGFGFGFGFGFGGTGTGTQPSVSGVTIGPVIQGGPAERAGLSEGDVITAIDGHQTPTWNALVRQVEAHRPGQTIQVSYVDTGGTSHTVSVVLAGIPR
ncbi:MAG TPA: trypsin-like peptidase domain-containing protein [Acidimicrobiales bacterium]|nr:trypsin-like peptidase domain-containing protein [Acidimicrobiales bacterium]